jgi:hypothetical protein
MAKHYPIAARSIPCGQLLFGRCYWGVMALRCRLSPRLQGILQLAVLQRRERGDGDIGGLLHPPRLDRPITPGTPLQPRGKQPVSAGVRYAPVRIASSPLDRSCHPGVKKPVSTGWRRCGVRRIGSHHGHAVGRVQRPLLGAAAAACTATCRHTHRYIRHSAPRVVVSVAAMKTLAKLDGRSPGIN